MTEQERQRKTDWLAGATPDQLINQLRWSSTAMTSSKLSETRRAGQEDYELVVAEIRKRLSPK